MLKIEKRLDPKSIEEKIAYKVVKTLNDAGFESYTVGGSVRDRLLGKIPHEVDVATSALPEQVQDIFKKTFAVGAAFGVIIVLIDDIQIEVATYREDGVYRNGRHPSSIRFSDAEHDARRRDFTINALFYDPFKYLIIDFTGGINDLDKGIINAIGNREDRFNEDFLRMLRAVRFSSQLNFDIEDETFKAILRNKDNINRISTERLFDELTKMLTGPNADSAFRLLDKTGFLSILLPDIAVMKGVKQPPEFHPEGDVWVHTLLMLNIMEQSSKDLAWSVLLHDIGKPPTFTINKHGRESFPSHAKVGAEIAVKILKGFHCSREFIEDVKTIVYYHMAFADVKKMKKSTLRRMLARKTFDIELELHRIDCLSSHRKLGNYTFLQDKLSEFINESPIPKPLLNGLDVIATGIPEGPEIGKILRELEENQLNNEINSRDEALKWLNEKVN